MIECQDLTKAYISGDTEAVVLKSVSFKIISGEFVAIMGPSGSGKSTLMHLLGALDKPTSGTYLLDGQDVSKLSDDELAEVRKRKIGFVFQSFNLLPRATVLRNVALPLLYANVPKADRDAKATAALEQAGLTESHYHHLSNQLSGGQMQRVAIARALVNNPAIILADEPTGNLDSKTGKEIIELLKDLNRQEKKTIVVVTHDREIAKQMRPIQIKDGQMV